MCIELFLVLQSQHVDVNSYGQNSCFSNLAVIAKIKTNGLGAAMPRNEERSL